MVAIVILSIIISVYIILNIDEITIKDYIYFVLIMLGMLLGGIISSYKCNQNDSNKSEALKSFIKKDTLFIDKDNITILIPK